MEAFSQTHFTAEATCANQIRVVLVAPTHMGNLGACARAMAVMGLTQLVLVNSNPPDEVAFARAAGGASLLASAKQVSHLEEAIGECHWVIGASARTRTIAYPTFSPKQAAQQLVARAEAGEKLAILMGCEQHGLSNAAMQLCHAQICIPTGESYHSLNLAMALQILTYEIRHCLHEKARPLAVQPHQQEAPASLASIQHLYQKLQALLAQVDTPTGHAYELSRLLRVLMQIQPSQKSINACFGILRALQQQLSRLANPTALHAMPSGSQHRNVS